MEPVHKMGQENSYSPNSLFSDDKILFSATLYLPGLEQTRPLPGPGIAPGRAIESTPPFRPADRTHPAPC